jgi:hypothetical protein
MCLHDVHWNKCVIPLIFAVGCLSVCLSVCRWMSKAAHGNEDANLNPGGNEADEEN